LVAGPRWVPETKTDWPTDRRSKDIFDFDVASIFTVEEQAKEETYEKKLVTTRSSSFLSLLLAASCFLLVCCFTYDPEDGGCINT
jgi:hypothetical protein